MRRVRLRLGFARHTVPSPSFFNVKTTNKMKKLLRRLSRLTARFRKDEREFVVLSITRSDLMNCGLDSNLSNEEMRQLADRMQDNICDSDFSAILFEAAEEIGIAES